MVLIHISILLSFSFFKDDKNVGESSILKLVDQADVGPYADFPLTIVKFRKGHTEDPTDDNSLWNITVRPSESTDLDLVSFLNYNKDKCVWEYPFVDSFENLKKQIADATDPANQAKIDICPDSPIVFEDIIGFSDKYFKAECLGGSGCVFDLDGYSFVTSDCFDFDVECADFDVEFQGITFENGSSVSYPAALLLIFMSLVLFVSIDRLTATICNSCHFLHDCTV